MENEDFRDRDKLFNLFREYREDICASAEHEWEQANISMGIAVYDPEFDPVVIDVARLADKVMYENKRLRKEKSPKHNREYPQLKKIPQIFLNTLHTFADGGYKEQKDKSTTT